MAKKTQAITKYDAEMAKYAQMAKDTEKNVGGGNFIGLQGGRMRYKGAEIPGNKMNVIVIDHILENNYYADKYDPDNIAPPDCYAFGRDEDEMVPHENSAKPQSGACVGCEKNEWGTADGGGGKGKACGNRRRLALVTEGDMEDVESAEIAYLRLPVTSVRAWAGYVRQCADVLNKPPFAVVTSIEVVPDSKTQFKLQFELVQEIDDGEALGALLALREKVEKEIDFPYQVAVADVKKAPRGGGGSKTAKPQARAAAAAKAAPTAATVRPASKPRVAVGARKAATAAKY